MRRSLISSIDEQRRVLEKINRCIAKGVEREERKGFDEKRNSSCGADKFSSDFPAKLVGVRWGQ